MTVDPRNDGERGKVRFQRANFVVSDLDRALTLYGDVLGMAVEFIKDSSSASYSYTVFGIHPGATVRFCVLSTPSQPRVMALTEVSGVPLSQRPLPRPAAIVLETPDIDRVVAEAGEAGFEVHPEGTLLTHDGRRGREVGLVDDDGNLTVIYTITGREPT